MTRDFDRLYAETGRPSIPPERLLKASMLIALYSVRSDRLFCEMLDYNILFRWFLDMSLEEPGLDQSNFSRLRERLVARDCARLLRCGGARGAQADLLSDEHFTVDGTLIEAWAAEELQAQGRPPPGGRVTTRAWSISAASGVATPRMPRPPTRMPSSCARARARNPSSAMAVMR